MYRLIGHEIGRLGVGALHTHPACHPSGHCALHSWIEQETLACVLPLALEKGPITKLILARLSVWLVCMRSVRAVCRRRQCIHIYMLHSGREGGPHVRLSHRIVHHAMAKQLPLS